MLTGSSRTQALRTQASRTRLSARLGVVAGCVANVRTVADIGSDHALVPIALVEAGTAQRAVAVEVSDGPLQAAQRAVDAAGMTERISVRRGDGLRPIAVGEVQAVVIAGMGAPAIWRIVTQPHALSVLGRGPRLVVQPMGSAGLLRFFADVAGMRVVYDARVKEDGFLYECLALVIADHRRFAQFQARVPEDWLSVYGSLASQRRMRYWCGEVGLAVGCDLLQDAIAREVRRRGQLLARLSAGVGERAEQRGREVRADMEALADLSAVLRQTRTRA